MRESAKPSLQPTALWCRTRRRRLVRQSLACALCLTVLLGSSPMLPAATSSKPIPAAIPTTLPSWRSDLPLADPVVDADAEFTAQRVKTWREGADRLLFLEGDVVVQIGSYGFRADRAVVRTTFDRPPGRVVKNLAIYLDNVRSQGGGGVTAEGKRLLVTASTRGQLVLNTDSLQEASAIGDPFVNEAAGRFLRYQVAIAQPTLSVPPGAPLVNSAMAARRQATRQEIAQEDLTRYTQRLPGESTGTTENAGSEGTSGIPANPLPPQTADLKPPTALPPSPPAADLIMPAKGVVTFNADKIVFEQTGPDESTLALVGNVRVLYSSDDGQHNLAVQAESAVIFLAGDARQLAERKTSAGQVRGLYLENNVVVTDGNFTVRAPRIYYDLPKNKAVLLQAVLYTWDVKQNIPIYMRAEQLRQESRTSWSANNALLTTTEFAEPHFAIAAGKLTFSQVKKADGDSALHFTAQDTTLRWAYLPVFYWPGTLTGDAEKTALRRVSVGYDGHQGPVMRTTWDVFALTGQPAPEGVDLAGHADYIGRHGAAAGLDLDYKLPRMFGSLETYFLPFDSGDDNIGGRNTISHHNDQRGFAEWQHRQYLPDHWELSLEFSYLSDPTFLEEYYHDKAEADKQYETSAYLKKQEDDWAFTLLTSYDLQKFTSQTTTLQAPGYTVDKLPELGYYRIGTSLWDDRLTYFSESRLSRLLIHAGKDTPADRGFSAAQTAILFPGMPNNTTSFRQYFQSRGVPTDWRNRLDSRHEIDAPMKLSIVDVTPYVSGRFTGYDQNFKQFSGETKTIRLMGEVGARAHTQFNKNYDDIDLPMLDVHRVRHILEPNVDVFQIATNVDPSEFPVYDPDVEGINEGFGTRVGMRNTLQTQRGGSGRWRSVDWLVLDTDYIHRSGDANTTDPVARYYSYRPEYSLGGDNFYTQLLWAISDTFAAGGELVDNFNTHRIEYWRFGVSLQQSPQLRHGINYTKIAPLAEQLLTYGLNYELTKIYTLGANYTYDVGRSESRSISGTLERKIPGWRCTFIGSFDLISDTQFFGVQLVPEGQATGALLAPPSSN